jgi:hypothetical protein
MSDAVNDETPEAIAPVEAHSYSTRMRARIELSYSMTRLALVFISVHVGAFPIAAFSHHSARRCMRASARALGVLVVLLVATGCVKAGVTVKKDQPMRTVRSTNSYRTMPVYEPMAQRKLTPCGDCGQTRLNVQGAPKRNAQMNTTFRKGKKK